MRIARTLLLPFPIACASLLALTSCTTPGRPPAPEPMAPKAKPAVVAPTATPPKAATHTPEPDSHPPPPAASTPTRPTVAPVAMPVIRRLAAQLMVDPAEIAVRALTPAEWPDACLGLPAEGEICAMAITPGFTLTLDVRGEAYIFRIDQTGETFRVASAPPPRTGEPLVTWRDSESFSMMVVGTQRVALGRRGRPLIAGPLAVPQRANELQEFLSRFAPFEARTPAGEIALLGVGLARATAADRRMIAEWARAVSQEARAGSEMPDVDTAMVWTRKGGIAGFCDTIRITRTGAAIASSCRGSEPVPIARSMLATDDLVQLYHWLDRLEPFNTREGAAENVRDAMVTTLDFRGTGVDLAAESDQQAMLAWVETLAVRLRELALR